MNPNATTIATTPVAVSATPLSKKRRWAAKGVAAVIDQGLISGSNFLLGIILARSLAPEQYGAYALGFSIFLLASLAYQAFLLEPQSIFGTGTFRARQKPYFTSLLFLHVAAAAAMGAALWVAAVIIGHIQPHSTDLVATLEALAIAGPCVLFFWLARGACYVELAPRLAAAGSGFYATLLLVGVFGAIRLGYLSAATAFLIMGACSLVIGAGLTSRLASWSTHDLEVREMLGQHWRYGRWAMASFLVNWIPGNVYYFAAGHGGLADAGALRALLNLLLPLAQTCNAVSNLIQPYVSSVHFSGGPRRANRLIKRISLAFAGGAALYWGVLVIFRHTVIHFLYGGKYAEIAPLLPWLAIGSVQWITANAFAIGLRAAERPDSVFRSYAVATVVSVSVGIPAYHWFGVRGAIISMVLANTVGLLAFLRNLVLVSQPTGKHSRSEGYADETYRAKV
jgi:O-antigen/teichoic acid export membrane protein